MAAVLCTCLFTTTAFAASDPLGVVNNLSSFIFSLIRAIGLILLGWGVVQVGLSFQSHDPSQRSQGFLTLAGGLVVTFCQGNSGPNHRIAKPEVRKLQIKKSSPNRNMTKRKFCRR